MPGKIGNKMGVEDYKEFDGKRVMMRVDYNVPLSNGVITNNQRIAASLATIRYVLSQGAKSVVLMSHLGRPDGKRQDKYSLKPAAEELEKLLGRKVQFVGECVGDEVERICRDPPVGTVILLENLRFHPEEEATEVDESVKMFRASLSRLGDVYVNDAFGTMHRAHSSIVGMSVPGPRLAGLLVQQELSAFAQLLESPGQQDKRIDVAVLGGAKVSDKIQLIRSLLARVKVLLVGGGMAFTLLKAKYNMDIGASLYDEDGAKLVEGIYEESERQGVQIVLPCDFVAASAFAKDAESKVVWMEGGIPAGWMGLDIGPESCTLFSSHIKKASSIFWNGPMGVFEWPSFSNGTSAVLTAMLRATSEHGALTIVGGGDSAAAVDLIGEHGARSGLSHVSTGGGAAIELMEGHLLPGISALSDKK